MPFWQQRSPRLNAFDTSSQEESQLFSCFQVVLAGFYLVSVGAWHALMIALMPFYAHVSRRELHASWPRNVANSLWALVRLRCRPSWLSALARRAGDVAQQMTSVERSNSLWAMARLRLRPEPELLNAMAT